MLGLFGTLSYAVFVRHLVISVLISLDQELSENVWFVWSEMSNSGDKWRCHDAGRTTNEQQTREDSATQPLDAGRLRFVKKSPKAGKFSKKIV